MKYPGFCVAWFAVVLAAGCSTTHHKEAADREVYQLIADRTPEVPGMDPRFTIEPADVSLDDCPVVSEAEAAQFAYLGEAAPAEVGAAVVSLEKGLDLAVRNSRRYQGQKESLYLQALGFTETRQQYRPVFSGRAGGTLSAKAEAVDKMTARSRLAQAAPGVMERIATMTLLPPDSGEAGAGPPSAATDLLESYTDMVEAALAASGLSGPETAIHQTRGASGNTLLSASMLMKGGATIAARLTSNFFRYLTGDPGVSTQSALVASITQPLLGKDRRSAAETLTQAQRDLLYELRSFTRFRKSFSIDIASEYYRVLQSRDAVRNNWVSYEVAQRNLRRGQAEAEADRITKAELGRLEEDALRGEDRWTSSIQSYQDSLDQFKITLGLRPTDAVVLDDAELSRLTEGGLAAPPPFTVEDAIEVALKARLDYYSRRDQFDDAARQFKLVLDDLKPDISLAFDATVRSTGQDRFQELDFKRYEWTLGLDIDPKLNRKRVRNRYRREQIRFAAAQRDLEEFEDGITLDVRRSWRALEQARVSHEIEKNRLEVSERRVLEQELKMEVGTARTLDLIDAQNDLVDARNSLSRAVVDHTLAYLRLWLDMGILYIENNGQWKDPANDDYWASELEL